MRPAALAIEWLDPLAPKSSSKIHSAGETQRATFRKSRRSVRRSQRNFAGQKDARSSIASRAQRESAQVKIGVRGRPLPSKPSRLCQNAEPPMPAIGILERRDERCARKVALTHVRA